VPLSSEKSTIKWTRTLDVSKLTLEVPDKVLIVEQFYKESKESGISLREFAETHCIAKSTFSDWKKLYDIYQSQGINLFHGKCGKPAYLHEELLELVKKIISDSCRRQKSLTPAQFRHLLLKASEVAKTQRGLAPTGVTCSRQYISDFKKYYDVGSQEVQFKTHARIEAESDPRNAYSMHVMAAAFCEDLSPNLIFNWDATQYVVSYDPESKGVFIKSEKADDSPLTAESSGGLNFAIKLYHFHNANGCCADPVFVIADDSMSENDVVIHKINVFIILFRRFFALWNCIYSITTRVSVFCWGCCFFTQK
jgi:hypothetical protein